MFCNHCGSQIPDGSSFCNRCGQAVTQDTGTIGQAASGGMQPTQPETSGKAIASLVTGLLFFILPSAIAAIVLGHIARSDIRKSGGRLQGSGIALGGLILGYMGVLIMPLVLIIAAIAIPNLLRARIAANEASTVQALRTIVAAELHYAESHPDSGFTCDWSALVSAELLNPKLAHGPRNGYVISLQNCAGTTSYQVTARPAVLNQSGKRAFCSDQSGVIRFDAGGSEEKCLQNGMPLR